MEKRKIKKYIAWGCLVALVAFLTVMPLLASTEETADGPQASILSAEVRRGTVDTKLIGGGTLAAEEAVEITIPASIKLTEFLVANGDTVQAGDPIATVDRVTVMTAITQVQETLEYLAEEIEAVSGEENSSTVTAQAGGTVKIVYAEAGDRVQDVMLEHGALAVLSLDGRMAVSVERKTSLAAGDTVCVTFSDDTEVEGRVESNLDGVLVVTIADDGYEVGEKVKVTTDDGDRIGSGELYIHNQWNAVGYSGTVKKVSVSQEQTVSAGTTLITLENTGVTAQFQQLSDQHREYEELMLELFQLYQTETLTAPCDGVVSGVDADRAYLLASEGGWKLDLLVNAPNGDDETTYNNFIGQVAEVGLDGWILKMNPQNLSVTDYMELTGVPMDPATMTEDAIYTGDAPIYELVEGQWQQIEGTEIAAGDILLFAGDSEGNFVWVVRVQKAAVQPDEELPAEPSEPEDPSEPDQSTESTEPTQSGEEETSGGKEQTGGSSQMGGSSFAGGFSGGAVQEEEYELYTLETATVASVTPQDTMTVEITIDELDITKLTVGQTAAVTVDALSGESFVGTITAVGNTGTSDGGNSKFTVELTLDRGTDMLNGMTATVTITLGTTPEGLTVPVAALNDDGTKTFVYTSYDEESGTLGDPVEVTVGVSDGENALIEGIDEGTTIYYAYYDTLEISNALEASGFSGGFSFFGK